MSRTLKQSNSLKEAFIAFASYGSGGKEVTDMDNKCFSKCCKDSGLVDKKVNATDVDLVFAKIKEKAARRISYDKFCEGLDLIAAKKGVEAVELKKMVQSSQPKTNATTPDAVKFHDDKSLYTGVYARGGPTNVDKDRAGPQTLSGLCDRSPANVRGVKTSLTD